MVLQISLPAPLSEKASRLAQGLGISIDELLAAALTEYLASHRLEDVTESLNQVYESEPSTIDPVMLRLQLSSLEGEQW